MVTTSVRHLFPISSLVDPVELAAFLDEEEGRASGLDPRELIEYRFFGPCSKQRTSHHGSSAPVLHGELSDDSLSRQ
ncbi:hypothetical protein ABZ805_29235 [Saccharopolyspora sp. NPDC047091]|uniref:hypothetical protein n=1 Tax=Saccharopolyspora sp. NPDC047091 TaxID=3155924 RepID=UPI0033FD104A